MGLFKPSIPKSDEFHPRGLPQSGRRWVELYPGFFVSTYKVDYTSIIKNDEGNRWRLKVGVGQLVFWSLPSENEEEIKKLQKLFL